MTPTKRSGTLSSATEVVDGGPTGGSTAPAGGRPGGAWGIVEGWGMRAGGEAGGLVCGAASDGRSARGLLDGAGRKFGKSFVTSAAMEPGTGICAVGAAGSCGRLSTENFGLCVVGSGVVGASWN